MIVVYNYVNELPTFLIVPSLKPFPTIQQQTVCYSLIKYKDNAVPVHVMQAYGGSKFIAPHILNLGSR